MILKLASGPACGVVLLLLGVLPGCDHANNTLGPDAWRDSDQGTPATMSEARRVARDVAVAISSAQGGQANVARAAIVDVQPLKIQGQMSNQSVSRFLEQWMAGLKAGGRQTGITFTTGARTMGGGGFELLTALTPAGERGSDGLLIRVALLGPNGAGDRAVLWEDATLVATP